MTMTTRIAAAALLVAALGAAAGVGAGVVLAAVARRVTGGAS